MKSHFQINWKMISLHNTSGTEKKERKYRANEARGQLLPIKDLPLFKKTSLSFFAACHVTHNGRCSESVQGDWQWLCHMWEE